MAQLTLRNVKGSPLTNAEVDANFNNINNELVLKLVATDYTADDVVSKVKSVAVATANINVNRLNGLSAATANIASTVVARDSNGDFAAGTITSSAIISSNLTCGNIVGNLLGTVNGNATNVSGTVAINNGGTGATTVDSARTALGLGTMAIQNKTSVDITGGTITGLGTPLPIASGGTGAATANNARIALGLQLGTDVQPFSNELTAIAGATSATGIYVRAGSGSVVERTIVAGGNGIAVSNGSGVSGNPSISIDTGAALAVNTVTATGNIGAGTVSSTGAVSLPSITKTGTNGTGDIGQTGNRFATIYGKSTSAQYADLAEKYTTDKEYEVGTVIVVSFDSAAEGTSSFEYAQRVLGVVSEKPAFLMNDEAPGQALALRGRVPVKVAGPIGKGQPLVANQDGRGIAGDHTNSFAISLETNLDPNVKLVECVIL
jgi:hypothetical protein